MWTEPETDAELTQFLNVCHTVVAYRSIDLATLKDMVARHSMELWLWQSGARQVALGFHAVGPSRMKIAIGVPNTVVRTETAARLMITQIRKRMDALGVDEWYANQPDSYPEPHMQKFADQISQTCWEIEKDEVADTKRRFEFKRRAHRKNEDSQFRGPRAKRRRRDAS